MAQVLLHVIGDQHNLPATCHRQHKPVQYVQDGVSGLWFRPQLNLVTGHRFPKHIVETETVGRVSQHGCFVYPPWRLRDMRHHARQFLDRVVKLIPAVLLCAISCLSSITEKQPKRQVYKNPNLATTYVFDCLEQAIGFLLWRNMMPLATNWSHQQLNMYAVCTEWTEFENDGFTHRNKKFPHTTCARLQRRNKLQTSIAFIYY